MSSSNTSGQAIGALALGIISMCFPLVAPIAIVLGIFALRAINRSEGALGGQGLAIGGIVTGGIGCALIPILAAIAIPNYLSFQRRSKQSEARVNIHALKVSAEAAFALDDVYPKGDTGWTPPEMCGREKCAADPDRWRAGLWAELDWSPMGPHYFQYRYRSDGSTYSIEARADLDGDGLPGHFRLTKDQPDVVDLTKGEF